MPERLEVRGLDKIAHFTAYAVITLLFILSLKNSFSLFSASILFFSISVLGVIDELTQPFVNRDMMESMKLLVDVEMGMFRDLNVRGIFLQNIVTDLLLGMGNKEVFTEFTNHIREKYRVEPAFNTMDMPKIVDFLLGCGIENPIVCSSINKIGYLMNPDKTSYEKAIRTQPFRPIAMSIMASGAVEPKEAVEYVTSFKNIRSIVFGTSSKSHIEETKRMIEKCG